MNEKELAAMRALLARHCSPAPIHVIARMGMPGGAEQHARRSSSGEPIAKGQARRAANALRRRLAKSQPEQTTTTER